MPKLLAVTRESNIRRFIGWFDDAAQEEPAYDPKWTAPNGLGDCIVCAGPLTGDNVRTVSVMWADRHGGRSLFYRMHRTCGDSLTDREHGLYDEAVLDAFATANPVHE